MAARTSFITISNHRARTHTALAHAHLPLYKSVSPSPSGGGGGPLRADFRSLNDSSSSSDSSPPPAAAGASPSFLPPLGGVLGENDPGTDFEPDEPFDRPDDPPDFFGTLGTLGR